MQPFSILMFIFSGMLLLYAGLLARSKDAQLIPRYYAARAKDDGTYAAAFAKLMAIVAMAPLGGGIYGLVSTTLGLIMLLINLPACIYIGTYFFRRNLP